ncbi:ImmA/IrrE family metallo-endopeptidase [Goodfellowiella coeruleoviolacea]|uniref:Zn-dependent peptidase ImmA, M78 family n=1 Tax=Goodfellowiella coeruleoviolacea TaxID=334858 RepID=A0AAE3GJK4_9PSEU|nr:XRE family transcriptional regulator [Goodfellowiella coeruleoviolacea]MCP2169426.1 Zn-dependent peptidase ImmA, M78 family [Goodfellowiella coeruleoviolacea]
MDDSTDQPRLRLLRAAAPAPAGVASAFDPARLTQARHLAGMTKKDIAEGLGVTPAAVGQYEAGVTRPRPEVLPRLAELLDVPLAFFAAGRPHAKLDVSVTHFRSLRSTRAYQRDRAVAFASQVWELTHALEKRVQMPPVDLPGFAGGEVLPTDEVPADPAGAARAVRRRWGLADGPVAHLVRLLESRGIVVTMLPLDSAEAARIDAFSTSRLPRPLIVLTPDRADDVHRHRFTAAHELGHLVLHGDTAPGDVQHEREADTFAAEFLTPRASIAPHLPARADFTALARLRDTWGVSIKSLLYRCRELGLLSGSSASRAYQRLNVLRGQGVFADEPVTGFPGEQPVLLTRAFELAAQHGLTVDNLAAELCWHPRRVRELLNLPDTRPPLRLVP